MYARGYYAVLDNDEGLYYAAFIGVYPRIENNKNNFKNILQL